MPFYLAIDFGTGSCRSALISQEGAVYDLVKRTVELETPERGFAELSTHTIWAKVKETVSELLNKHEKVQINMVGVSSMTGYVLLGEMNMPIMPATTWMDTRAEEEVKEIEHLIDREVVYSKTGRLPSPELLAPILLWLKKYKQGKYREITSFYGIKDEIVRRLTGTIQTDYTYLNYSMLYNINEKSPDEDICRSLGISRNIFPKVKCVYDVAGAILPEVAEELGLPPGIPVIVGASDGTSAMYGSGIKIPGKAVLVSGSTETLRILSDQNVKDTGMSLEINHAIDGVDYLIGGAMGLCGGTLLWLQEMLDVKVTDIQDNISLLPPGSDNLIFAPGLSGERSPYWKSYWKGGLVGLSLNHRKEHLFRAMMEGICYREQNLLTTMKTKGIKVENVVIVGGCSEIDIWNQIRADIIGMPVIKTNNKEATILGIARFCRIAEDAAGFKKIDETEWSCESKRYYPDPEKNRIYRRYSEIFKNHLYRCDGTYLELTTENF